MTANPVNHQDSKGEKHPLPQFMDFEYILKTA
jgi:hypothetical protein